MSKKIVLIGHCGPDASYLKLAVGRAVKGAQIVSADEQGELNELLSNGGADLVLLNRQLDWGFATADGIELIRQLRETHPQLRTMLVSNFPEAQQAAVSAGALPGFGKKELGSPRVSELLRSVLEG